MKRTDAVVKRARARRADAVARAARIAEDAAALRSGRKRQQSRGWMLPERSLLEVTRAGLGAGARAVVDGSSPATDTEGQISNKRKPEDARQSRSAKENDGEGGSCGDCIITDEEVEQVLDHRTAASGQGGNYGDCTTTSVPDTATGAKAGDVSTSENAVRPPDTERNRDEGSYSDGTAGEAAAAAATTSSPDVDSEEKATLSAMPRILMFFDSISNRQCWARPL